MPVEIERKFLVVGDGWREAAEAGIRLRQGYVSHDSHGSVRVRLSSNRAWLTLKSGRTGLSRYEYEYEIPLLDAEEMLDRLCAGPIVEKTRHRVAHDGKTWEVDVFEGCLQGLVLAELELNAPDEYFRKPSWIGEEVTDDRRYRNSAMGQLEVAQIVVSRSAADLKLRWRNLMELSSD